MTKSTNPMEAYRREQKKKELKKHRLERKKDKEAKLGSMDSADMIEQIKNLERQVATNPTDGPTRKRKQELEDTLRLTVKKQHEMVEEKRKKMVDVPPSQPKSMIELTEANKEKYQNPENSIYYHETLNPFGAPPPGMPQMYRNAPFRPVGPPKVIARGPPRRPQQQSFPYQLPLSRSRGGPPATPTRQQHMMTRRPGKRPPLPPGPPPPGTIQVASRPPLPSGAIPARPPPPPPPTHPLTAGAIVTTPPPSFTEQPHGAPLPPLHYPAASIAVYDRKTGRNHAEVDMDQESVFGLYPTTDELDFHDSHIEEDQEVNENAAKQAAESQSQLRLLVPVALCVQRQVNAPSSSSVARISSASSSSVPDLRRRPASVPRPTMSSVSVIPFPPHCATTTAVKSPVSKKLDTFMEEVKELL